MVKRPEGYVRGRGRGFRNVGVSLRRGWGTGTRWGLAKVGHYCPRVWWVQAAGPGKVLGALGGKSGAGSPSPGADLAGRCGSWLETGPQHPRGRPSGLHI